ncbi:MAG: GGDEF domain-containing protein [Monoglobales bacterium]
MINNLKRKNYETLDQRIFNSLIVTIIVVTLIDGFSWYIDNKTFILAYELNKITNALLYAISPLCGLVWAVFVDFKIYKDEKRLKTLIAYALIPFVINFLASMSSIFHKVYFTVNQNNLFERNEPFSFFPFLLAILYGLYSIIITVKNQKNISRKNFYPILSYMFIPMICTFIQATWYGLSLVCSALAISLVIVYISVQNEVNVTDYLTGLSNRSHLVFYLESELKKLKGDKDLYGLMLDMDNFKCINDNYGHFEGDKALAMFSGILKKHSTPDSFIARYAGDEFVIILKLNKDESIDDYISELRKSVENFNRSSGLDYVLDYSLGYAKYLSKETYKDFLSRMDANMYFEKNKKKQ